MEYAVLAKDQGLCADRPSTPLDEVEVFADRIERLTGRVNAFAGRFFDGPRVEATNTIAPREIPMGYNGQLKRIGVAIDQLDLAVQRLSEIG